MTRLDLLPKARVDNVAMDEPNGGAAALGGDENADAATDDENGRYTQHCIIFCDFLIPL